MQVLVGRVKEMAILENLSKTGKSEFIAIYGRRRVGKTFLIRQAYAGMFAFQLTGIANAILSQQLTNFNIALSRADANYQQAPPSDWLTAFQLLASFLENSTHEKKVVFLDELPWLDTPRSGFLQALEHFWNSWASARNDIILIVCGSAASWMIHKLINNKGGLHNRVTMRLKLVPFSLHECELFLQHKNAALDRYQVLQLYMVLGGIPFYWEQVTAGKSAAQNIEAICFSENGLLRTEFHNLFSSLFTNWEKHIAIVQALATKSAGLTREEILKAAKIPNAGSATRLLSELEESGFLKKYIPFGKKSRDSLYQLVDFYSLFYLKFIQDQQTPDSNYWLNNIDSPVHRAWSGYAFEQVCLWHIDEVKKALGIAGIQTKVAAWRGIADNKGAQIDLLIDRRDRVINLCEMKFSIGKFSINKKYAEELRNKITVFKSATGTQKAIFLTLITSFGVEPNSYSLGLIQNEITMDALFD